MLVTKKKLNRLVMTKLPSAFLCGVKVDELTDLSCVTTTKYKWITTNPFKSIYFAVLAMAAELSTGSLVLKKAYESSSRFSTLVVGMNSQFTKKAVGKIRFECLQGEAVDEYFSTAVSSNQPQAFHLTSIGYDEVGDKVAEFVFNWSIKPKA